ncbi:DUF2201 family putative metallopeptidase [Xylanimonas ulmi]|uniref:Putative metal-dependent peptidase n=1 Tax=Xylanimonas ulmi TaxID=228973 RepID=A0A4Q7M064_9MICO|nr:VWA-like domain-containing protein [Xylanibacterium ulmi]RZS60714.1 putative metal-dependent peptidase [Xylanibacterium ulmi]
MSAPTRPLTSDEREAFRLGRLVAAERAPYFMHALFAVSPVAAPGLDTFAVDGAWRLYLDPDLLTGPNRWDSTTIGAVLLHEVGHLLRDHAGRAANLPNPRHNLAWNLAGDAEINDDLLAAGIPLPADCVTPGALGCEDGDLAETYYAHLVPPTGAPPALPDDGSAGCGSGSGCPPAPGELPAGVNLDDGTAAPITAAEGDLVRRRVANAVQEAAHAKGRGSVPAGLSRWASDVLAPPTVPWERVLRAAVRRAVADRAGRVDYTYSRPSRRRLPRIIKPAMRAPSVIVSVVVDTSGSMGQADLTAAMSEVTGVLHASGVAREHLRLLSVDAAATKPQRIRSVASINLTGGGGTDMRVGIAAAEAATRAPHVVIVLTDGLTAPVKREGSYVRRDVIPCNGIEAWVLVRQ